MCLFKKKPLVNEKDGEALDAMQVKPAERISQQRDGVLLITGLHDPCVPHLLFTETHEYRPCWVNKRKALFHRWVNSARPQLPKGQEPNENSRYYQYRATHALVEYEDGTMATIWPTEIRFVDNDHFTQYWSESGQEAERGTD